MNNLIETPSWYLYVETPHHQNSPTKIDIILAERMKAFLRSRTVRPFDECLNPEQGSHC